MRNIKKTGLILGILLIFTLSVNAQNTFELLVENNLDEVILDVCELPDGSYVLTGFYKDPNQVDIFHGYLIKINENGVVTDSIYLNEYAYCMLHNIHFYNNELYVIAALKENTDTNFTLGLFRLNTDLEIFDVKTSVLPGNKQIGLVNSIIDSDENLVMCGGLNDLDTNGEVIGIEGFLYKISMSGDSLNCIFFNENFQKIPHGIIENFDSTGYFAFIRSYNNNSLCSKVLFNKALEEVAVVNLTSEIFALFDALHSATHASPVRLSDGSIMLSGRYYTNETHFVFTVTDDNSIMATAFIENDNRIQWANTYGNSVNGNHIYSGYTSNVSLNNFYFSHDTSHIHILKFDEQLNTIWHKAIGGDAYYNLYRVLACNDGGCLLVGNRFDYASGQGNIRNVYIAKLNQDGEFVWQKTFSISNAISIYPNPAIHTINFSLPENISIIRYSVFNLQGELLLSRKAESNSVNIDVLAPGAYIIQLTTNMGIVSKRFLKME